MIAATDTDRHHGDGLFSIDSSVTPSSASLLRDRGGKIAALKRRRLPDPTPEFEPMDMIEAPQRVWGCPRRARSGSGERRQPRLRSTRPQRQRHQHRFMA
jgi:hypothetical protein